MKSVAAVVVSVPLFLGFGSAVASADVPPDVKGQPNTSDSPNDVKTPGGPTHSVGLISVFQDILKDSGSSLGEHSSSFAPGQRNTDGGGATGRVGVGNLGRTDGLPGDDPNSHFTGQLVINMNNVDVACQAPGGTNPSRQGNPNSCG